MQQSSKNNHSSFQSPEDEDDDKVHDDGDELDFVFPDLAPSDGETLVAQVLNSLSIDERQSALHDIHGVSERDEEDPTYLSGKLSEM